MKTLDVRLIDEKQILCGFYRRYQVGVFRVSVVLDVPVLAGSTLYIAEVYDRSDKVVPGTAALADSDDEAVRECLTKWVGITKPPATTFTITEGSL